MEIQWRVVLGRKFLEIDLEDEATLVGALQT